MKVEVINTGTELLLGEILNTNFQYLSRQLNKLGFDVLYQTTVGDNAGRLKDVFKTASLIWTPGTALTTIFVNAGCA